MEIWKKINLNISSIIHGKIPSCCYTGWYWDLFVEIGLRNNAKETAAMMTKKAVIACNPTQPVPLGLLVELVLSVARFLSDCAMSPRFLPLSIFIILLGVFEISRLSDEIDPSVIASSARADNVADSDIIQNIIKDVLTEHPLQKRCNISVCRQQTWLTDVVSKGGVLTDEIEPDWCQYYSTLVLNTHFPITCR